MRIILSIITIGLLTIVICSTAAFSQTGKWTQLFPTHSPPARSGHGMAYLGDDKILVFGGCTIDSRTSNDTWIYDLSDNDWTEVKCDTVPASRDLPAMVYIGDGKVFLFGGYFDYQISNIGYGNDTWIFDLATLKWTEKHTDRQPYPRDRASCAYLGNNKVLLFAGNDCPGEYSKFKDGLCHDTWIYELNTNKWDSITNDYPRGRALSQMCEVTDDKILLYGGSLAGTPGKDNNIFDKKMGTWQQLFPKVENLNRKTSTMVNLQNNITFVFGGDTQGNQGSTAEDIYSNDSWIFDFEDSTWIELFPETIPQRRHFHKMAKLSLGKAILFGGLAPGGKDLKDTWKFEYNPTGVKDSGNLLIGQIKIINKPNNTFEVQICNLYDGKIDIELYDINGNLLKSLYSNINYQKELNIEILIDEFSTGAYFVLIKTKQANYYKQILVVH